MKLQVLYHGHCFDGVASAALFTRFHSSRNKPDTEVGYTGLLHRPGALFSDLMFSGDENAIVDFKFSPSERLTWWFDHHQSAFLSTEDERTFQNDRSGRKFWDPTSKSCAEFIARVAKEQFAFDDPGVKSLVEWAHIIDGALYESAAQVVQLAEPALQLMQVIENAPGEFNQWLIRQLTTRPLEEVANGTEVQTRFQPIYQEHLKTLEAIRRTAVYDGGVVYFDLVDERLEGFNKFIPYFLYPDTTYCVALTLGTDRAKISVGSNPWSPRPRTHNIASICERYGGGGHAVVGAVSMKPEEIERARSIARDIATELLS